MSVRSRIEAAGGSLIRQPDSKWVISVWYIPGGYDYTNAKAVVGFFPNELYDVVSALEEEWDCMPEMASVMDLRDPKVDAAFQREEHLPTLRCPSLEGGSAMAQRPRRLASVLLGRS